MAAGDRDAVEIHPVHSVPLHEELGRRPGRPRRRAPRRACAAARSRRRRSPRGCRDPGSRRSAVERSREVLRSGPLGAGQPAQDAALLDRGEDERGRRSGRAGEEDGPGAAERHDRWGRLVGGVDEGPRLAGGAPEEEPAPAGDEAGQEDSSVREDRGAAQRTARRAEALGDPARDREAQDLEDALGEAYVVAAVGARRDVRRARRHRQEAAYVAPVERDGDEPVEVSDGDGSDDGPAVRRDGVGRRHRQLRR